MKDSSSVLEGEIILSQRTEQEIMRNWKYADPPLVSVCSITYNHELFIRDALDSFLMQETDFPFDVIIHDDASTDRTADIIREYVEMYPHIIKPFFQTENQYSKSMSFGSILQLVFLSAQGEYIALCEGDDYWTDPRKLQIQIEEMRKRPECDISFHPAFHKYMDKTRPDEVCCQHRKDTCVIPLSEVIRGDGGFCPTASLIIKKNTLNNFPEWFYSPLLPFTDYFIQVYGAKNGGALFINIPLATYRYGTPNSWTYKISIDNQKNLERYPKTHFFMAKLRDDFPSDQSKHIDYIEAQRYANEALLQLNMGNKAAFLSCILHGTKLSFFVFFNYFILYCLKIIYSRFFRIFKRLIK